MVKPAAVVACVLLAALGTAGTPAPAQSLLADTSQHAVTAKKVSAGHLLNLLEVQKETHAGSYARSKFG